VGIRRSVFLRYFAKPQSGECGNDGNNSTCEDRSLNAQCDGSADNDGKAQRYTCLALCETNLLQTVLTLFSLLPALR
jgi:hypothetical protein